MKKVNQEKNEAKRWYYKIRGDRAFNDNNLEDRYWEIFGESKIQMKPFDDYINDPLKEVKRKT